MKKNQATKEIVKLDATGKIFGRLASQVAILLRGKNKPGFNFNTAAGVKVVVTNLDGLKFTGNKLRDRMYYRFSGYPSGLKKVSLGERFSQQPEKLFQAAVRRMLPKNRLSARLIKNLQVYRQQEK